MPRDGCVCAAATRSRSLSRVTLSRDPCVILPPPSTSLSVMAQLLRSPKPGSDWTANELCAYNITVVPQNKEEFFRTTDFPDPAEPSLVGFMTAETRQDAADKRTKQLLHYLDLAMDPKIGQEAALTTLPLNYCEVSSTTMKIGLFSSDMPSLFLFVEKTQSPRLTFASWMIMKFCCCCRRTRD